MAPEYYSILGQFSDDSIPRTESISAQVCQLSTSREMITTEFRLSPTRSRTASLLDIQNFDSFYFFKSPKPVNKMISKTRLVLYSCSLTSALCVLAIRPGLRQTLTLSCRNLDSYTHITLDITVSHPAFARGSLFPPYRHTVMLVTRRYSGEVLTSRTMAGHEPTMWVSEVAGGDSVIERHNPLEIYAIDSAHAKALCTKTSAATRKTLAGHGSDGSRDQILFERIGLPQINALPPK
ncbi:hypothetical protein B0H14DRAFT_2591717 [Mycena olivaceomarginata]|nr:hypothetical protein B0H14DRAFT_2591717 [Mycena olivaceomarginata]